MAEAELPFTNQAMRPERTIWYYNPFPGIIPVHEAGYLCVTHPFAAVLAPEGTFSLDLHA